MEYQLKLDGEIEATGTLQQVWEHSVARYGHLTLDHLYQRGFIIEPKQ